MWGTMSSPARRPGNRPSRRSRESKAYNLTLASGGFALATVVTLVLAIMSVVGYGIVFLLAALTAVCALLLRNSLR